MRRALIITVILLSLTRLDRTRAKKLIRGLVIVLCRQILNFVSKPYEVENVMTLIIAPHQDDETLGCGALIARRRNEGLPVHVAFITDGRASHPNHPFYSAADIAALRNEEARRSLSILGVETGAINFLNEPDGTLATLTAERRSALLGKIVSLLVSLRPQKVLFPVHGDGSSEHEVAFTLVIEAMRLSGHQCELWQYAVWAWWNPSLLVRLVFSQPHSRRLLTEDYRVAKQRALFNYRSQTEPLLPWKDPTLPAELVKQFMGDSEYFFRYVMPDHRPLPAAAIKTNLP